MESTWLVPLIVAVAYLLLFVVERRFPLRAMKRPLWERLRINVFVTALALAAAALLVNPTVEYMLEWSSQSTFGLLPLLGLPLAVEFLIAFLLFDWSFYWWHRAHHHVPLLWRFHNAHHIDPDLDVTTAFRFHPVEIAYSAAFRGAQILLIGPAIWMYFAYELVFQISTLFHHSNLKLPVRLERALNLMFVTPRMHGVHHSDYRDETDSNYSTVFSWWDRLHRTLRLNVRQREIDIGVPAYSRVEDNSPTHILRMPFRHQRPYWQRPDGTGMDSRVEGSGPTGSASQMKE